MGYHTYSDNEEIMKPAEAKRISVFAFDDVACEMQQVICEYFSGIPKQLVRDNANMVVLFKQDETPDMSFENFCDVCAQC